jgi:hypothetical protein
MKDERTRISVLVLMICCDLFFAAHFCLAQQAVSVQVSMDDKQAFQQLEDNWSEAINERDRSALEHVLSRDMVDISESGAIRARKQYLWLHCLKGKKPLLLDQRVVNVRTFGDVAIVIGTYTEKVLVQNILPTRSGLFTHVYHKVNGNWFCICAHRTIVTDADSPMLHKQYNDVF